MLSINPDIKNSQFSYSTGLRPIVQAGHKYVLAHQRQITGGGVLAICAGDVVWGIYNFAQGISAHDRDYFILGASNFFALVKYATGWSAVDEKPKAPRIQRLLLKAAPVLAAGYAFLTAHNFMENKRYFGCINAGNTALYAAAPVVAARRAARLLATLES